MTEILSSWLNQELELSKPIQLFNKDFCNGYALAEVLFKLNMMKAVDFDECKVNDQPGYVAKNFCKVAESLRSLGVNFSPSMVTDIMAGTDGAALRLIYQIKMQHAKVSSKVNPMTKTFRTLNQSVKDTVNLGYKGELPISRGVLSHKLKYDTMNHEMIARKIHSAAHVNEKIIHMDQFLARFHQNELKEKKLDAILKEQDKQSEAQYYGNLRRERLDFMLQSRKFKHEQVAKGQELWIENLELRTTRKKYNEIFAHTTKITRAEKRLRDAQIAGRDMQESISRFEETFNNIESNAQDLQVPDENGISPEASNNSTYRRTSVAQEKETMDQDRTRLNDRKVERDRSREERSYRRKSAVLNVVDYIATGKKLSRIAVESDQSKKKSQAEQRIDEEIWRESQFKHIVRENRRFLDQQYDERGQEQAKQRLARDMSIHNSVLRLHEEQVSRELQRYEQLRRSITVREEQKKLEYCEQTLQRVLELVHKAVNYKELTDQAAVAEQDWSGWMVLFEKGGQLLPSLKFTPLDSAQLPEDKSAIEGVVSGNLEKPVESNEKQKAVPEASSAVVDTSIGFGSTFMSEIETHGKYLLEMVQDLNQDNAKILNAASFNEYLTREGIWMDLTDESPKYNDALGCIVECIVSIAAGPLPVKDDANKRVQRAHLTICLLGQAFAGKKCQAAFLCKKYNLASIIVEDLVLEATSKTPNSELHKTIADLVRYGSSISDQLYVDLIVDAIAKLPLRAKNAPVLEGQFEGWVLVGFPETKHQAELLEYALSGYIPAVLKSPGPPVITHDSHQKVPSCIAPPPVPPLSLEALPSGIDLQIILDLSHKSAARRALGRRQDPVTNKYYHIERKIPDLDNPVKERLIPVAQCYDAEAKLAENLSYWCDHRTGLEAWCSSFATLHSVDGEAPKPDVFDRICILVESLLDKRAKEQDFVENMASIEAVKAKLEEELRNQEAEMVAAWDPAANRATGHEDVGKSDSDPSKAKGDVGVSKKGPPTKPPISSIVTPGPLLTFPAVPVLTPDMIADKSNFANFVDYDLAILLAKEWINLELTYSYELKSTFEHFRQCRNINFAHYSSVRNNFLRMLRRADNKQNLVEDFTKEFNTLHADLRRETFAKEELHLRVDELQDALNEVIADRRQIAEDHFEKIQNDQWFENTAYTIMSLYSWMMQLELRRYFDSLGICHDFFSTLKEQVIPIPEPNAVVLPMFNSEILHEKKKKVVKPAFVKKDKTKIVGIKSGESAIETSLVQLKENYDYACGVLIEPQAFNAVADTKDVLQQSAAHPVIVRDAKSVKSGAVSKVVKVVPKKNNASQEEVLHDEGAKKAYLCDQQLAAIIEQENSHLKACLTRLNKLAVASLQSLSEAVETKLYGTMREWIDNIFTAETQAIEALAFVIKATIEDEKPIHYQLRLHNGSMFIDRDTVIYALPTLPLSSPFAELRDPANYFVFTPNQLVNLANYIRLAASSENDTIPTSDLVQLLTRMVMTQWKLGPEEMLPLGWQNLREEDFEAIVNISAGNSDDINWKSFLVKIMFFGRENLIPTQVQLMSCLENFIKLDTNGDFKVNLVEYESVLLWFKEKEKEKEDKVPKPERDDIVETNVIGGEPMTPEPFTIRQFLFDIWSIHSHAAWPVPNDSGNDKAVADVVTETIGTAQFLPFIYLLLHFCLDDKPSEGDAVVSGLQKFEFVQAYAQNSPDTLKYCENIIQSSANNDNFFNLQVLPLIGELLASRNAHAN